jgi:endonuclease YncB( thermonuclease family)
MLIAPEDPGTVTIRVPVLKVFDGDGFLTHMENPQRGTSFDVPIRFGFIDAPEMEQPGGNQAKEFLHSLIGGKWVDLVILTKMDTGGIVDRHRRIVAIPYLKVDRPNPTGSPVSIVRHFLQHLTSPSFRNIELEMVLNGWAWVLDRYEPGERYFDALNDAQKNRRGIWAFADNLHPWEFKKQRYGARRTAPKVTRSVNLHAEQRERLLCPAKGCGGQLVERNGRYGSFLGCSNFPKCQYSRSIEH